jgi:hypothetical protein
MTSASNSSIRKRRVKQPLAPENVAYHAWYRLFQRRYLLERQVFPFLSTDLIYSIVACILKRTGVSQDIRTRSWPKRSSNIISPERISWSLPRYAWARLDSDGLTVNDPKLWIHESQLFALIPRDFEKVSLGSRVIIVQAVVDPDRLPPLRDTLIATQGLDQLPREERERRHYSNQQGLSRKHIFDSVERSLKELDLEYIDLLQIHRADENTPFEETMCALKDIIQSGKVRCESSYRKG